VRSIPLPYAFGPSWADSFMLHEKPLQCDETPVLILLSKALCCAKKETLRKEQSRVPLPTGGFTYALVHGMFTKGKKKALMVYPAWKGSRPMDMQSVWGNNFKAWRVSYEEHLQREEEQEQAKLRQIMELLPLPRRAAPRVWEDLASAPSAYRFPALEPFVAP